MLLCSVIAKTRTYERIKETTCSKKPAQERKTGMVQGRVGKRRVVQ
jgi:hypothetical protein